MNLRQDRRRTDRRHGDRRGPPRSTSDEAWLSAWGDASPSRSGGYAGPAAPPDTPPGGSADQGFMAREARRMVAGDGAALPRILRAYVAARAALGLALALAPWLGTMLGARLPLPLLALCLVYAGQAVSMWLLHDPNPDQPPPKHLQPRQWLWTIGVDLLVFSALRLMDPQGQLNYSALLVLPVLMSAVLTQRRLALATAAGVTLMLLVGVWLVEHDTQDVLARLSLAGLGGAGMFGVTLLASELAQRLAREERLAISSLEMVRQQTLLNRLVIEEMADGVLVVDRSARVRAINPAARALLGVSGAALQVQAPLAAQPRLQGLAQALDAAYLRGAWPAAARELALDAGDGETRVLLVRARFTRRGGIAADGMPPEDICVLFLEDVRHVQARARQDKLAAMGRMSAGIAHELRNPLAAIAQANALLLEDKLPPQQQQLASIVADNVRRLKRIVDDVLAVAPGMVASSDSLDAVAEVRQICQGWLQAGPADNQALAARLSLNLPAGPLPVRFDADHLLRVLVNLLDNASRHASQDAAALQVTLGPGIRPGTVRLTVASDGPAIAPDVERHLFEPFFSTRSRGSGLGLYICRELCERHGASIEFALAPPGARHRNVFWVALRAAGPA